MNRFYFFTWLFLLFTAPAAAQLTVTGFGGALYVNGETTVTADAVAITDGGALRLVGAQSELAAGTLTVDQSGEVILSGQTSSINARTVLLTDNAILLLNGIAAELDAENLTLNSDAILEVSNDGVRLFGTTAFTVGEDGILLAPADNHFISAGTLTVEDGGVVNLTGGGSYTGAGEFTIVDGGVFRTRGDVEVFGDLNWNGETTLYIAGGDAGGDYGNLYTEGDIVNVGGTVEAQLINGYAPTTNQRYRLIDLDLQFTGLNPILVAPAAEGYTFDQEQDYLDLIYDIGSLPVEWLSFTGQWQGKAAELNWQTGSETGSDHFAVERRNLTGTWEDIGTVAAAGTSTRTRDYGFLDDTPGPTNPVLYRLRQVDLDGSFTHSAIVALRRTDRAKGLGLYPNPATDHVFVSGLASGTFTITEATGKVVARGAVDGSPTQRVNLPGRLPTGTYFVRDGAGNTQRFTIAR